MANPVTLLQLQEASQDCDTLESFVNGDENAVNHPRLRPDMDVGSLAELRKKVQAKIDLQIATLPNGRKGYATLAEARAAQASLPTNTIIEITNDTDKTNNGAYLWDGLALTKFSMHDLLQQINLVKNQINDNYTAFVEFLKLYNNNTSTVNNVSIASSFASDMQIPTDKFDVSKGVLQGVVLGLGASGSFDEAMVESPYIIYDNNLKKFVMVYTAYDANHVATIGWATSTDLVSWIKQGKLISPSGLAKNGDAHGMTGPGLYYYKGLYYLYYLGLNGAGYEGEPINMCLATTASLTSPSWTYHGIKIPIQTNIAWANQAIYHPNLFTYNGVWYMFFNARGSIDGDSAERFGFATANNIDGEWTVNPTRVSQALELDNTFIRAGDPAVFEYNGLIYVFYFRVLPDGTAIDSWGWTTPSEFPFGWRYGGDLLATNVDYQHQYAHKPFVVKYQNKLYHYYTAVGSQGRVIALKTYDI